MWIKEKGTYRWTARVVSMVLLLTMLAFFALVTPTLSENAVDFSKIENTTGKYTYIDFDVFSDPEHSEKQFEGYINEPMSAYFGVRFLGGGTFERFQLQVSAVDAQGKSAAVLPYALFDLSENDYGGDLLQGYSDRTLQFQPSLSANRQGEGLVIFTSRFAPLGAEAYRDTRYVFTLTGVHRIGDVEIPVRLERTVRPALKSDSAFSMAMTLDDGPEATYFDADSFYMEYRLGVTPQNAQYFPYAVEFGLDGVLRPLRNEASGTDYPPTAATLLAPESIASQVEIRNVYDASSHSFSAKAQGKEGLNFPLLLREEAPAAPWILRVQYPKAAYDFVQNAGEHTLAYQNEVYVKVQLAGGEASLYEATLTQEGGFAALDIAGRARTAMQPARQQTLDAAPLIRQGDVWTTWLNTVNLHRPQGFLQSVYYYSYSDYTAAEFPDAGPAQLQYKDEQGKVKSLALRTDMLRLDTLAMRSMDPVLQGGGSVTFYERGKSGQDFLCRFTAGGRFDLPDGTQMLSDTYVLPEAMDISDYYAVVEGADTGSGSGAVQWESTYRLKGAALFAALAVGNDAKALAALRGSVALVQTQQGTGLLPGQTTPAVPLTGDREASQSLACPQSDFVLDAEQIQGFSLSLPQAQNEWNHFVIPLVMRADRAEGMISNRNPVFYVELPQDWDYDGNSFQATVQEGSPLHIVAVERVAFGGKSFLKVATQGVYTDALPDTVIRIVLRAKVGRQHDIAQMEGRIGVWMETDDQLYAAMETNQFAIHSGATVPSKLGYHSFAYTLQQTADIATLHEVEAEDGSFREGTVYREKDRRALVRMTVANAGETMWDAGVVVELPQSAAGSVFSEITRVEMIEKNGYRMVLPSSLYTVRYSSQWNAGTDLARYTAGKAEAKRLLLRVDRRYPLLQDERLVVEYRVHIPADVQDGSVLTGRFAPLYTRGSGPELGVASPVAGFKVGAFATAGTEVSLQVECTPGTEKAGFTFQITGKKADEQGALTETVYESEARDTDAQGRISFGPVPPGVYQVRMLWPDDNGEEAYYAPEAYKNVVITGLETQGVNLWYAVPLRTGYLKITQAFEANLSHQEALYQVEGTLAAGEPYSAKLSLAGDGAGFFSLPYGEYTLTQAYPALPGSAFEAPDVYWGYDRMRPVKNIVVEAPPATDEVVLTEQVVQMTQAKGTLRLRLKNEGQEDNAEDADLLEGRTFLVRDAATGGQALSLVLTTDEAGNASAQGLPVGRYGVEELDVPDRYTAPAAQTNCQVRSEETPGQESDSVRFINAYQKGALSLQIIRGKDAQGAEQPFALEGFTFRVWGESDYGNYVDETLVTDVQGNALYGRKGAQYTLEKGTYQVQEVQDEGKLGVRVAAMKVEGVAQAQDAAEANTVTVQVREGHTAQVSMENLYDGKGAFMVVLDMESHNLEEAEGSEFMLYTTDLLGEKREEVRAVTIKDIAILENGDKKRVTAAVAVWEDIPAGKWELVQTKAVEGYAPLEEVQSVVVRPQDTLAANYSRLQNHYARGKLEIQNASASEQERAGVTYEVTPYKVLRNILASDEMIRVQTDAQGYVKTLAYTYRGERRTRESLPVGKYLVKELAGRTVRQEQLVQISEAQTTKVLFLDATQRTHIPAMTRQCALTLESEILNAEGTAPANQKDYKEAGLNAASDYPMELTLENKRTGDVYNLLLQTRQPLCLDTLPPGVYQINAVSRLPFAVFEIRQKASNALAAFDAEIGELTLLPPDGGAVQPLILQVRAKLTLARDGAVDRGGSLYQIP